MKKFTTNNLCRTKARAKNSEKGIALVLALLMAMVLFGGASALLIRMIGSRRLSASESSQQLAEAAAVNGFNRILAELNNKNKDEYLGFLYQVSNGPQNDYAWSNGPEISEPCAAFSKTIPDWHSTNNMLRESGAVVLNKPGSNLTTYFRLRSYEGPQGKSSAQFEVEGIVKRGGSNNVNEARSLLRRSLFVSSIVATDDDWAVLAGRDLNLGALRIEGEGIILKLLPSLNNFVNSDSCNATNLLASANANDSQQLVSIVPEEKRKSLAELIWPVANIGNNQWDLPTSTYFSGDGTTDEGKYEPGVQRIWAFDDRMVMDPSNPDEQNHGMTCGDRETYSIVCARPTSNQPDKDELHEIPIPASQIKKTLSSNGSIADATISIKASYICNKFTQKNANVCQIFVEHINLSKTRVLIENDISKPIVLKLQLPNNAPARNDLTRKYALSDSSIICGTNSQLQSCNNKSELFVITSDSCSIR